MSEMKSKYVFFYGGVFSQWFPATFRINGTRFGCAEQYMMFKKAQLFKDELSMTKIMKTDDPAEQKALGKKVTNFDVDTWNAVARNIVYTGNLAKFTQNVGLLAKLLETEDKLIVEASPYDRIWGIGLGEFDPARFDKSKWKGTNWLGQVLTKLREDIFQGRLVKET